MDYNIIFTDQFKDKLYLIVEFIKDNYENQKYINLFLDEIQYKIVNTVKIFPEFYPTVIGESDIRKVVMPKFKYNLYYKIIKERHTIYFFDIISFRQNKKTRNIIQ